MGGAGCQLEILSTGERVQDGGRAAHLVCWHPCPLSLASMPPKAQEEDVSRWGLRRPGLSSELDAKLIGVAHVQPSPMATCYWGS